MEAGVGGVLHDGVVGVGGVGEHAAHAAEDAEGGGPAHVLEAGFADDAAACRGGGESGAWTGGAVGGGCRSSPGVSIVIVAPAAAVAGVFHPDVFVGFDVDGGARADGAVDDGDVAGGIGVIINVAMDDGEAVEAGGEAFDTEVEGVGGSGRGGVGFDVYGEVDGVVHVA